MERCTDRMINRQMDRWTTDRMINGMIDRQKNKLVKGQRGKHADRPTK